MVCENCQGRRYLRGLPCGSCGGSGIMHCCEGPAGNAADVPPSTTAGSLAAYLDPSPMVVSGPMPTDETIDHFLSEAGRHGYLMSRENAIYFLTGPEREAARTEPPFDPDPVKAALRRLFTGH